MLENVEAIFGLHVSHRVPTSLVASKASPILATCGFFDVVISGKGVMQPFPNTP